MNAYPENHVSPADPGALPGEMSLQGLLARLDEASGALARMNSVVEENELLSHELCRNYEQIHFLIDFTCEISGITDPREIHRLLLARIAALLASTQIVINNSHGQWRNYEMRRGEFVESAHDRAKPERLASLVKEARSSRMTTVKITQSSRVLILPFSRLDNQVDLVFIERARAAPEFTSADLRFCETLLAFGGQILCNTELHEQIRRASMETTRALVAAIDKKDRYTSGHSERVGFLSRCIGEWMQLGRAEIEQLEWSGVLHDVGKIGVPEEILNKPGKLTPEEFEIVKRHPEMGHEILKHIKSFQHILDGVLYHHEQPDGGGYPRGLKGDEIPLAARIIHVADVFDALSSARSYRANFDIARALDIMRQESGTKLDNKIVLAFFEALAHLQKQDTERFAEIFPHLNQGDAR